MKKKGSKSSPSRFLKYTSIPIQMGVTIYLGKLLGDWVEGKYGNGDGVYSKSIILVAIFLSMFQIIREVIKLTNKDHGKK